MKTRLIQLFIIAVPALCLVTGCVKPSNVKSDSTDSKKEVKKEDGKEKEQKRDLLLTPDLKMHELAGNVKEVKVYSENKLKEVVEFDRNGELVLQENDKEKIAVKRDNDNRIIHFTYNNSIDLNQTRSFSYNSKGYPETIEALENNNLSKKEIEYDSGNRIVRQRTKSTNYGIEFITIKEYEYISIDENGNWTERKMTERIEGENEGVDAITETREIIYY